MKLHAILISTAISCVLASSKLISLPFKGVERTSLRASGKGLVDAPLENIDLAYLIDIQIGIIKEISHKFKLCIEKVT